MQNRIDIPKIPANRQEALAELKKSFDRSEFPGGTIKQAIEIEIRDKIDELGEAYAPLYSNYLRLLKNNKAKFNLQNYNQLKSEYKTAFEQDAREKKIANDKKLEMEVKINRVFFDTPRSTADDVEAIMSASTRVGIFTLAASAAVNAIVTIAMDIATSAGVLQSNMAIASSILDVTTKIVGYVMPAVLVSIAYEGLSDSFKALTDENTDARGFSIVEGFLKTGLASAGLAVFMGALSVPMPLLFMGIVLGGVAKSQAVLGSIRENMVELSVAIDKDKTALWNRINELKEEKIIVNEDNIVMKLSTRIAENEKKLQIQKIKEESAVHSRDKLLVIGVLSISLLIAAAACPPLSVGMVVLTAIGMGIFLALNRYLNSHAKATQKKIENVESRNPKEVIAEVAANKPLKTTVNKTEGYFEKTYSFFRHPVNSIEKMLSNSESLQRMGRW
jgi:hypothetical protein